MTIYLAVLTEYRRVTDGHTDRQTRTSCHGIVRAMDTRRAVKTQEKSLEFTINRVLMKIFRTVSVDVIWCTGHKRCWLLSATRNF